jgi:hypothetical protein
VVKALRKIFAEEARFLVANSEKIFADRFDQKLNPINHKYLI